MKSTQETHFEEENIDPDFRNLFRFIKKNKELAHALDQFSEDHQDYPNILRMLDAVKTGNYDSDIFDDQDADLYLLYLMKTRRIPFWEGMTFYSYMLGLMQFTDRMSLRPKEDNIIERERERERELKPYRILSENINAEVPDPFSNNKARLYKFNTLSDSAKSYINDLTHREYKAIG